MSETQKKFAARILVVDDETQLRRLLRLSLEENGYCVFDAASGHECLALAAQWLPDIVLLDLGLPDLGGNIVLRRLRQWSRVPVIILTVRDRENEKIAALDAGADDYVTKPFSTGELIARVRAALRRAQPVSESVLFRCGPLEIDFTARTVKVDGREIKLTVTEYSLLRLFAHNRGKALTHRQILNEVWGPNCVEQTHYLRVYMAHLREKLEANPAKPALLITEPGVGYRLVA